MDCTSPTTTTTSSARVERQLAAPAVPPMIRSKLLLDEAMRLNWEKHCHAFQRKVHTTAMSPPEQQEGFEMLWFQFRCEWRQLYSDALSELKAIPLPEPQDDPESHAAAIAEYAQEAHAAFYPVVMMELFQKEVHLQDACDEMAVGIVPAGSRGHWAQLYQLHAQSQQALPPLTVLTVKGIDSDERVHSYDDLSSVGGMSDNNSFTSASLSPTPHELPTSPAQSRPLSPQPKTSSVFLKLASTETPQCPMDYNTIRYDAELRSSVVSGRRERMKELLGAIPPGSAFVASAPLPAAAH